MRGKVRGGYGHSKLYYKNSMEFEVEFKQNFAENALKNILTN